MRNHWNYFQSPGNFQEEIAVGIVGNKGNVLYLCSVFAKKYNKFFPFQQELTQGWKAESHSRVYLLYNTMELILQLNDLSLCTERERTKRATNSRDENSSITIMKSVQIEITRENSAVWDSN